MNKLWNHPRVVLLIAVAVAAMLTYPALYVIEDGESGGLRVGLVVTANVIVFVANAWTLRKRGRSLWWLLFYLGTKVGADLVPVVIALFAKERTPTEREAEDTRYAEIQERMRQERSDAALRIEKAKVEQWN